MLYYHKRGRYQRQYDALLNLLVPKHGKADTIQGGLVQAVAVLASDYRRNASSTWNTNDPAQGYHNLGSFLVQYLNDESLFDSETLNQIERDYELMRIHGEEGRNLNYTDGEDVYDRMTDRVIEFCRAHPDLIWIDAADEKPVTSIASIFA